MTNRVTDPAMQLLAKGKQNTTSQTMAKYYVESGQVRVVFDAENATEAAVRAFQWSCDKQAGIESRR